VVSPFRTKPRLEAEIFLLRTEGAHSFCRPG
jgi:hypothetical protein